MRSAGRGDHNVGLIGGLVKIFKANGGSIYLAGHVQRTIVSAVGDEDGSCSVRAQVASCQFAHLAGADHVHMPSLQAAKYLFRELHRDRGDRNSRTANRRLSANPLGYGKGPAHKSVK